MKQQQSFFFLMVMIIQSHFIWGQQKEGFFHLDEILQLALVNAPELKLSNSDLRESQLSLKSLQERFKPQVFLNGTLPGLSRSIEPIALPDGRDAFVNRSSMFNRLGLRVSYQLESTGGTIFAESNLDRLDILQTDQLDYSRNYFATPISLGIEQPLFQFNEVRWQKEELTLLNRELTAQQFMIREEVLQNAITLYSTVFVTQLELELAAQKLVETDSLLLIKQRLFDLGQATKVEILRLELELAYNQQRLEQAEVDWEAQRQELCDYLELDHTELKGLYPPPPEQSVNINPEKARELAMSNAYLLARFDLRLRTVQTAIERAEKERGIIFNVRATVGLNNSTDRLEEILQNMSDRQTISLGFTVPLTAAGNRQINREIAQEQLFQEMTDIEVERREITRTVTQDVATYQLLNKNIALNERAMKVAQEILDLSRRQYLSGSISFTELNVLTIERDQALLEYYRSILQANLKYHEIRRNCLYDFKTGKSLVPVE
jgi:outer membrane protein